MVKPSPGGVPYHGLVEGTVLVGLEILMVSEMK